jgi:hypothetical protein
MCSRYSRWPVRRSARSSVRAAISRNARSASASCQRAGRCSFACVRRSCGSAPRGAGSPDRTRATAPTSRGSRSSRRCRWRRARVRGVFAPKGRVAPVASRSAPYAVDGPKPRAGRAALEHGELQPEHEDLYDETRAGRKPAMSVRRGGTIGEHHLRADANRGPGHGRFAPRHARPLQARRSRRGRILRGQRARRRHPLLTGLHIRTQRLAGTHDQRFDSMAFALRSRDPPSQPASRAGHDRAASLSPVFLHCGSSE